MKNEHRRRYTREFKPQALDMAETSGKSVAQIEDELDLAPGMTIAVEPAVYLPGETGIRLEDVFLILIDGAEVLTHLIKARN